MSFGRVPTMVVVSVIILWWWSTAIALRTSGDASDAMSVKPDGLL